MTSRPTDGIRRLCGVGSGARPNEFAEATVRKAAIAEACDRVDERVRELLDAESETARRVAREDALREVERELDGLRPRLMPEGMEWPRFEDGEPVRIGDEAVFGMPVSSVELTSDSCILHGKEGLTKRRQVAYKNGERVKRPAPKVLAADGEPLEVGQTVWGVDDGREWTVSEIINGTVSLSNEDGIFHEYSAAWVPSEQLTHQRPVFDADGVLCREGDEVWEVRSHRRREIVGTHYRDYETGEPLILCDGDDAIPIPATCVTHAKPEPPDSWERLEEDAWKDDCEYFERDMNGCKGCPASRQDIDDFYCDENEKAKDLVRRCKALAEKENRNE